MYKVLIVDDESIIREGIAESIRKDCPKFQTILEARDGEEALNLALESSPDLVITDIQMPNMNGIEFIEQLKAENPDVAVIIISGHDDFEYAQKGLKLGVSDYLLKPVESGHLTARLRLAAEEFDRRHVFRKDQAALRQMVAESLPLYRERLYRHLIEGVKDMQALRERAGQLGISLAHRFYAVALLRFGRAEAPHAESDLFADALLADIVRGTAERFVQELDVHAFFLKDGELALLIGSSVATREMCFAAMNAYLNRTGRALQKNIELSELHISMGTVTDTLHDLPLSYQQAQEAMLFRLSVKNRTVLNFEELGNAAIPETKTASTAEQLILYVKLLERHNALRHVREYMDELAAAQGAHPHWVKLSILELTMSLLRAMEEAEIKLQLFLQNKELDPYVNVYRLETFRELQTWLERFVEMCISEMENGKVSKSTSHVEKVKQYIETRIADSELSLSSLAVTLFLSPNYLRQLFRQETGESFVEYVTRVRMEKALEYLKDPTLKIADVAEKVGFEEQRYFSSCFKKFHQMTPTEYREALQYGLL
ncbi:response regulator [Paenibacillus hamazuiensis]|uniref:response regulator n=1 Tax=Paenibacillus hamazuiensis TaxID=2936508 RepID=UPI00200BCECA|nr:response regulator [Paenibacillus hamazuiensis]